MQTGIQTSGPQIVFVGAGPGDPDLLTVRAARLLAQADVVLYDALVSDAILALIRPGAKRFAVGKRAGTPCIAQDDINRMLVRLAKPGRVLVRLKGGDPAIFARLGEEIAALEYANIPFEIVPGITTASAAVAANALSLTSRGVAQRVQFVTAHAKTGDELRLDWRSLADPQATTVFYMARGAAAVIAERLMSEGLDPRTPVLLACDVGSPSEISKTTTLSDLPLTVTTLPSSAPTIIIVGAALAPALARAAALDKSTHDRRRYA